MIITISGVAPYDGAYPLDLSKLSMGDWRTIKRLSGVRGGPELSDAFRAEDQELFVALAAVALSRKHASIIEEVLWEAPAGRFAISFEDEEADAVPPPQAPSVNEPAPSEPSASSGPSLSGTGDPSETSPSPTGTPV